MDTKVELIAYNDECLTIKGDIDGIVRAIRVEDTISIPIVALLLLHNAMHQEGYRIWMPHDEHVKATNIALTPAFRRQVVSPKLKDSPFFTPISKLDYTSTMLLLSFYQPITLPLVELGFFDTLFNLLPNTRESPAGMDEGHQVLQAIKNILRNTATYGYITPHHIDILLNNIRSNTPQIISRLLPLTGSMIPKRLLATLQASSDSTIFPRLRFGTYGHLTASRARVEAVNTMCNLPNPTVGTLQFLSCLFDIDSSRWTTRQVRFLFHHTILTGVANTRFRADIPQELCEAIREELRENFADASLTRKHVEMLQQALRFGKVRELVAEMGMVPILIGCLVDAELAPSIPALISDIVENHASFHHITFHHIEPLLQYLITTDNPFQLNAIICNLHQHKMASEIMSVRGVLRSIAPLAGEHSNVWNLLRILDKTKIWTIVVSEGISTNHLPRDLQAIVLEYYGIPLISRDRYAPWYIDAALLPQIADGQHKYVTIPGQPRDVEMVTKLYQRSPVSGYDIKSISIVHSEHLFNSFIARIESLQQRAGKPAFSPHWISDNRISQEERTQRQKAMELFRSIVTHTYNMAPDVSFVLSWHGTRKAVLESLFLTGFANLASTDAGFFGKGLYTTPDAEYAFRVYSSGALLVNWVAVFSPFPVLAQDEPELAEKGNFRNYDAHFVPVHSPLHPKSSVYRACANNQEPQYSELVVFESAQMLAHYVVELQPTLPMEVASLKEEKHKAGPLGPKKGMVLWSVAHVCSWFLTLPLSQDYSVLLQQNGINGEVLVSMTQQDWKEVGMNHFGDSRLVALRVSRYED